MSSWYFWYYWGMLYRKACILFPKSFSGLLLYSIKYIICFHMLLISYFVMLKVFKLIAVQHFLKVSIIKAYHLDIGINCYFIQKASFLTLVTVACKIVRLRSSLMISEMQILNFLFSIGCTWVSITRIVLCQPVQPGASLHTNFNVSGFSLE